MFNPSVTPSQLLELSMVLRAIAMSRKEAGAILHQLALAYEIRAANTQARHYAN